MDEFETNLKILQMYFGQFINDELSNCFSIQLFELIIMFGLILFEFELLVCTFLGYVNCSHYVIAVLQVQVFLNILQRHLILVLFRFFFFQLLISVVLYQCLFRSFVLLLLHVHDFPRLEVLADCQVVGYREQRVSNTIDGN